MKDVGKLVFASGAIVKAVGLKNAKINSVCFIGQKKLLGEIIKLENKIAIIQVYESTKMLKVGDKVLLEDAPLTAELGPGLLGSICDGLQRPLKDAGMFLETITNTNKLDRKKLWLVIPKKTGAVNKGDVIAEIKETKTITHKIFAPINGVVTIKKGNYKLEDTIGTIKNNKEKKKITLLTKWPIHKQFSKGKYMTPKTLLVTGQRVLDTMFPLVLGGSAAMPGGFGSGKTILGHQLAKWAAADIVIFIGVGERGNEMADVLTEFPEIEDEKTNEKLMARSVLIANTSNMPVAARITSIHFGSLVGEYYRNMGYNVLLIADSTSRWSEALRELSGMQEEMPGEEGYPVYLASEISKFYERAGVIETDAGLVGSLSIVGAVSPPGGDFAEPVTDATKRVVECFWSLNVDLAYHRHYPAVDWNNSYSNYDIENYEKLGAIRKSMTELLQKEKDLERIVRLVGYESLPKKDRFALLVARLFRENFLQQSAFHEEDKYCTEEKQHEMIMSFVALLEVGLKKIKQDKDFEYPKDIIDSIARMKFEKKDSFKDLREKIEACDV